MNQLGYSTDVLFDEVFLSYAMRKEKDSVEIHEEMTQQTGLNCYYPLFRWHAVAGTGKRFGFFQSVLVKTNHMEEHQEWQEINKNIVLESIGMNTLHKLPRLLLAINAVLFIMYGIQEIANPQQKPSGGFRKPRFCCWLYLEEASEHGSE